MLTGGLVLLSQLFGLGSGSRPGKHPQLHRVQAVLKRIGIEDIIRPLRCVRPPQTGEMVEGGGSWQTLGARKAGRGGLDGRWATHGTGSG